MSINRTLSSLLMLGAGLLLSVGEAGAQQTPQNYDDTWAYGNAPYSNAYPQNSTTLPSLLPFGPVGFRHKWDPFAPADISDYGTGPKAKVGFFFNYERLYWSISKPARATVGDAALDGTKFGEGIDPITGTVIDVAENNSLNTGIFTAKGSWGNRWETGFMDVNDHGWLISVIDHVAQTQNFEYNNATILFNDPNHVLTTFVVNPFVIFQQPPGPNQFLPISTIPRFPDTFIYNRIVLNGVEVMRMFRAPRLHNGSYLDLLYGVRWFQADDTFEVDGFGGPLADSFVRTRVQNNMVGPQLGLRWFMQRGRWINSAEARFCAAANFENFRQTTQFASQANVLSSLQGAAQSGQGTQVGGTLNANASNSSAFSTQFAPITEIRLQTVYQVTRAVGLKIGYTFMYVNGIARASDHTDYTAPIFGLLPGSQRDNLIINGLSFGVEVNR